MALVRARGQATTHPTVATEVKSALAELQEHMFTVFDDETMTEETVNGREWIRRKTGVELPADVAATSGLEWSRDLLQQVCVRVRMGARRCVCACVCACVCVCAPRACPPPPPGHVWNLRLNLRLSLCTGGRSKRIWRRGEASFCRNLRLSTTR